MRWSGGRVNSKGNERTGPRLQWHIAGGGSRNCTLEGRGGVCVAEPHNIGETRPPQETRQSLAEKHWQRGREVCVLRLCLPMIVPSDHPKLAANRNGSANPVPLPSFQHLTGCYVWRRYTEADTQHMQVRSFDRGSLRCTKLPIHQRMDTKPKGKTVSSRFFGKQSNHPSPIFTPVRPARFYLRQSHDASARCQVLFLTSPD